MALYEKFPAIAAAILLGLGLTACGGESKPPGCTEELSQYEIDESQRQLTNTDEQCVKLFDPHAPATIAGSLAAGESVVIVCYWQGDRPGVLVQTEPLPQYQRPLTEIASRSTPDRNILWAANEAVNTEAFSVYPPCVPSEYSQEEEPTKPTNPPLQV